MKPDHRSPQAAAWRHLYSTTRWRALRTAKLRESPLCRRPIHGARAVPAAVVNHVRPHRGNLELFFDPENLEAVCKPCHDGPIQSAEKKGFDPAVDADGYPIDPAHPAYSRPG